MQNTFSANSYAESINFISRLSTFVRFSSFIIFRWLENICHYCDRNYILCAMTGVVSLLNVPCLKKTNHSHNHIPRVLITSWPTEILGQNSCFTFSPKGVYISIPCLVRFYEEHSCHSWGPHDSLAWHHWYLCFCQCQRQICLLDEPKTKKKNNEPQD